MSFFKNLLNGLVKDVVENVVESAVDGGKTKDTAKTQTSVVKSAEEEVELKTVELVLQNIDGSRECNNTTYDGVDDIFFKVEQYYSVAPGFWSFDSGAGEVDIAYTYDPDAKSQEESEGWDVDKPYIAIMCDDIAYKIIQQYKNSKTVKTGNELEKVNHDIMKYKSAYSREDGRYIQYHFYRFDSDLHYHIQAFVHNKYQGTEVEEKVLAALELMAATYREENKAE